MKRAALAMAMASDHTQRTAAVCQVLPPLLPLYNETNLLQVFVFCLQFVLGRPGLLLHSYKSPLHVLYALETLTCYPFLVFALHLPPAVLVLQPPLCGTRSHLAFATLPLPIPSVAFLKLTASSRLLAPSSGSPKCLR